MSSIVQILLPAGEAGFVEDKDKAREIRVNDLLPALSRGDKVVLDFQGIHFATQSFVHALIGEALKRHGEDCLDQLEFKNCSTQLQSLIELVVDYSLGGFSTEVNSGKVVEPTS